MKSEEKNCVDLFFSTPLSSPVRKIYSLMGNAEQCPGLGWVKPVRMDHWEIKERLLLACAGTSGDQSSNDEL